MKRIRLFQERDLRALGVILPFLTRYRWQVAAAFVCLLGITATTLIVPILMKWIVDSLSAPEAGKGAHVLAVPMGLLLGYGLVRFASVAFRELRATVFGRVSVRAMRRLSLRLLTHLHSLDLEYHLGPPHRRNRTRSRPRRRRHRIAASARRVFDTARSVAGDRRDRRAAVRLRRVLRRDHVCVGVAVRGLYGVRHRMAHADHPCIERSEFPCEQPCRRQPDQLRNGQTLQQRTARSGRSTTPI